MAAINGLKDCCVLSFFKDVLLDDPEGILVAPGPNSRSVRMVKVTGVAQIAAMEAVLKDYVRAATEIGEAGRKVDFKKDDLPYPDEIADRLARQTWLREAFEAPTPGRRRGYLLHFLQPMQAKTRVVRIEKAAPRILGGRGLHDR